MKKVLVNVALVVCYLMSASVFFRVGFPSEEWGVADYIIMSVCALTALFIYFFVRRPNGKSVLKKNGVMIPFYFD